MKRGFHLFVAIVALLTISCPFTSAALAQDPAGLEVSRAAVCLNVVDREPVEPGATFATSVGKLCCFTHITGAQDPSKITHVWYFADAERARVTLPVKSVNWRTFSSKIIQKHEVGNWHVEVLGPDGAVLQDLNFETTP